MSNDENRIEEYYQLWQDHVKNERWKQAVDAILRALEIDPDSTKFQYCLGYSYEKLGGREDLLKAVEAYQRSIEYYPQWPNTFYRLGGIYENLCQPEKAISAYNEVIKLDPNHYMAYFSIGQIQTNAKQYKEAAEAFRVAIRIKGDYAEAHYGLSNVLSEIGNWKQCARSLEEAVKLDPDNEVYIFALGITYSWLNRKKKALAQYNILNARDNDRARELLAWINRRWTLEDLWVMISFWKR